MVKKYNGTYMPNIDIYGKPSKYFMEVPRVCYQMEDLTKNDILVYSAILAGLNNQVSDVFSYPNKIIAKRIAVDERQVRRSVNHLKEQGLITVSHLKGNRRHIRVKDDLRINKKTGNKNVIRVYDRIFSYPLITKPMVHVYSYYLSLGGMDRYQNGCNVVFDTVSKSLGYSKKQLIVILDEMVGIGLVQVERVGNRKNVKLLVDFSKEQPEERHYQQYLEQCKAEQEEVETQEPEGKGNTLEETHSLTEHNGPHMKKATMGKKAIAAYEEMKRKMENLESDEYDDDEWVIRERARRISQRNREQEQFDWIEDDDLPW